MADHDESKHVEHVDVGFEVTVKSKRGTGTRDQDEVTVSLEQRDPVLDTQVHDLLDTIEHIMDDRRAHQPDEEEDT